MAFVANTTAMSSRVIRQFMFVFGESAVAVNEDEESLGSPIGSEIVRVGNGGLDGTCPDSLGFLFLLVHLKLSCRIWIGD